MKTTQSFMLLVMIIQDRQIYRSNDKESFAAVESFQTPIECTRDNAQCADRVYVLSAMTMEMEHTRDETHFKGFMPLVTQG